ncbi:MAG: FkbM family methyltransferase [Hyphomicrobiaceae bacterium]|nr:FkbM family methyltransferase [Hyphomicrobiaceae bacterium]
MSIPGVMKYVRRALDLVGYDLVKRDHMRYGVDILQDVKRLANRSQHKIEICFDVGANIGQTSQQMVRAFPDATIHAFEPVTETYDRLVENVAKNQRIITYNYALGERSGSAEIEVFAQSELSSIAAQSPFITTYGERKSVESIGIKSLDDFCASKNIDNIDYLKIDTEGYDLNVLRGGTRALERGIPFVSVEFYRFESDTSGTGLSDFESLFLPLHYRCVSTYVDHIHIDKDWLIVANALFVWRPK